MNYTENYHLPQWVKDDRIMMEDFNQMCKDMESGLTENRDAAASANQKTANRAEDRAFDRICRLAYNHYCALQAVRPAPRQLGVFHRDTSASGEGLTGFHPFDGFYQLNHGTAFTAQSLFDLFDQQGEMVSGYGGYPLPVTVTFTAPASGSIDYLLLHSVYEEATTKEYPCQLTFEDLTAGKVVKSEVLPNLLAEGGTQNYYPITVGLPFHIGHQYRLTIVAKENYAHARSKIISTNMRVTCNATGGEGSAAHTFQHPDENLGMVAAASYHLEGDSSEAKLLFNGEEIPAWWVRDVQDEKGRTVREAVFRRNGSVENGDRVELCFASRPGGETVLYSWGAVLL